VPGHGVNWPPGSGSPCLAHRVEPAHQHLEALRVVEADNVEIGLGRAAADTELQPSAGHRVERSDTVRQLDRVPHRHLQHARADLDSRGDRGDDAHPDDRVERRAAAAE
jgi:hypothetical protein